LALRELRARRNDVDANALRQVLSVWANDDSDSERGAVFVETAHQRQVLGRVSN
jgi:hypothetical protein